MSQRKSKHWKPKMCPTHNVRLERMNTRYGFLWKCMMDGCTVRCWGGETSTPADDETRAARIEAHAAFDALWQPGPRKVFRNRGGAYTWLHQYTGKPGAENHIGMFTAEECRDLVRHINSLLELGPLGLASFRPMIEQTV